ncbi:Aste57867_3774 [Aphanomyces stellatus]|uniref:Aste57867_3774 protein n=1 Tax=Aphanomyces stellatus TaxID=120398 RepID=A0A485KAC8_9STRA|nr:hypothetical protein As57867_003763 [Aphanomyces stellatus]VFT80925.1 Aste57867_3774 [Aphanomyces stellatus]
MFKPSVLRRCARRPSSALSIHSSRTTPVRRALSTSSNAAGGSFKPTKEFVATEAKEVFKLLFGTLTVMLGGSMTVGYAVENYKRMHAPTPPGQLVDITVDGHAFKVHVQTQVAAGTGPHGVTVLLDGSLGETSFDWERVATSVSDVAKVIAIDRPGLGFSTAGMLPRTSATVCGIAKEYQAVLQALNITGPVILVGHGIGGYHMRHLAAELIDDRASPIQVAGLVLVDAMQESVKGTMDAVSPQVHDALAARQKNAATLLKMSHFGLVRLVHTLQTKRNAARFSTTALPFIDYFTPSPIHRRGVVNESDAVADIEASLLASPLPDLKQVPLVVLSHGNNTMFASMRLEPGIDDAAVAQMEAAWAKGQDTLTTLSARAVHRVVTEVGHDMPHEKPGEVVAAILALINEQAGQTSAGIESLRTQVCAVAK